MINQIVINQEPFCFGDYIKIYNKNNNLTKCKIVYFDNCDYILDKPIELFTSNYNKYILTNYHTMNIDNINIKNRISYSYGVLSEQFKIYNEISLKNKEDIEIIPYLLKLCHENDDIKMEYVRYILQQN